jgi:integrase/recombinase XerD
MKHLPLTNPSFIYLENSFKEWLTIIGYVTNTIESWTNHVHEYLHYLEQRHITQLTQITPTITYQFIHHVKHRKSERTGTGLSTSSINKTINAVNAFAKYINTTDKHTLDISPKLLEQNTLERIVLSTQELKQIYQATFTPRGFNNVAMGQRDRAILAIFYGCGLRKAEGSNLNIFDIDLQKALLFVRKAKGNKQRYVPIAAKHLQDIKDYLEEGRNWFLLNNYSTTTIKQGIKKVNTDDEAFFLNTKGKRMCSFEVIFKQLKEESGILTHFSTHTLRHSIATHLLQSGMKIEDIAKFLGHASLESTQIYTHLLNTQH